MREIILTGFTENHHSLYEKLLILLSKEESQITVLTRPRIANILKGKLNLSSVKFIEEQGSAGKIIKRQIGEINKHDVLLMEYYGAFHRTKFFDLKCPKKVLLVHNANKWIQPILKYEIKHLFDQFFRNSFFDQFDGYITMGPNVKEYLDSFINKPIFFFPFDLSMENRKCRKKDNGTINIVLPGTVSADRRNYKSFLKVLETYYDDYPESLIRIKLLGKIDNRNDHVTNTVDRINKKFGNKIKYWNEFIPDGEFKKNIIEADFILSNIKVFAKRKDSIEVYGITKESGVSFIIYKYAKPGIVPQLQHILSGLDSQLIKFRNYNDLYLIFKRIETGEVRIKNLKNNAIFNKKRFNQLLKAETKRMVKFIYDVYDEY